jgi:hypothetical protein
MSAFPQRLNLSSSCHRRRSSTMLIPTTASRLARAAGRLRRLAPALRGAGQLIAWVLGVAVALRTLGVL